LNGDAAFGEQAFRGGMALWGGPQEQAPRATPYIPGGLTQTDIDAVNAARQPMAQPMQAPRPAQRMAAPAPMAAPVAAPEFPIPGEPPGLVAPQQGSQIIESDLPPEPEQPEMQTRILPPQEPALPQGFENTEIAKRGQAMGMDPRQILVALAEFSAGMGNIKGKPQQSTARSFYEMQKKYEQQNRQNAMGDLQMAQRAMPKPIEPIDPVTQQYKQMQIDYLKSKMQPKPAPEVDTLKRDLTQAQIDLTRARQKKLETPEQARLPVAVTGEVPSPVYSKERIRNTTQLRNEYQKHPVTSNTMKVNEQMGKVEEMMKNPNAATDMSLIFAFMKTLDPGSTVREGEYASAANATSAFGRVQQFIGKAGTGQNLTPEQKRQFLGIMRSFRDAQNQLQKEVNEKYGSYAGRIGVDPRDLMPVENTSAVQAEPQPTGPRGLPIWKP
jgi:hypothetical protein